MKSDLPARNGGAAPLTPAVAFVCFVVHYFVSFIYRRSLPSPPKPLRLAASLT